MYAGDIRWVKTGENVRLYNANNRQQAPKQICTHFPAVVFKLELENDL